MRAWISGVPGVQEAAASKAQIDESGPERRHDPLHPAKHDVAHAAAPVVPFDADLLNRLLVEKSDTQLADTVIDEDLVDHDEGPAMLASTG